MPKPADDATFDDESDDRVEVNENALLLSDLSEKHKPKRFTVRRLDKSRELKRNDHYVSYKADGHKTGLHNRSSSAECNAPSSSFSSNVDPNVVFVEKSVQKDDSLRNIALQYGVTVNELKRVNGLLSDQEFYGREVIKVPVKKYGIFIERLQNFPQVSCSITPPFLVDLDQTPSTSKSQNFNTSVVVESGSTANFDGTQSLQKSKSFNNASAVEFSLANVDADLDKARRHIEKNGSPVQPLELGPAANPALHDVDLYVTAALRKGARSTWWQRNVTHFVVVVLLIFIVVVIPLFILLYNAIMAVEHEDNDQYSSTTQIHDSNHH